MACDGRGLPGAGYDVSGSVAGEETDWQRLARSLDRLSVWYSSDYYGFAIFEATAIQQALEIKASAIVSQS